MGIQWRKWIKFIGITLVVLIFGYFMMQYIVKSNIETALSSKLPETLKLTYGDLDVSLFNGKLSLKDIQLTNFGKTVQKPNVEVNLEKLSISGLSYWNYLVNDIIKIDNIYFKNPNVTYYYNKEIPEEAYQAAQEKSFNKRIEIKEFKIEEGQVKIIDSKTDSLKLRTQNIQLKLKKIIYSLDTKNRKIPIDFESYDVFFDSFFAQLSEYENVTIKHAALTNDDTELKSLKLYTKYSKETFSRIIPFERDHYNLEIDSILVERPSLEVVRDSVWSFESDKVTLYQPDFKVYRNKLVADDVRIKPLYSKMLRDLKIDLNLENVLIQDADISYSEKVKVDEKAGVVAFSEFYADIKHVSNIYQSPTKTTLDIKTLFMDHAPLKAVWSFDVNNKIDLFKFQAEIDNIQASYLNRFTEPNLNVRLEGELEKTYLTISGNDNNSTIDFKLKYEAFDVIALKNDGNEKNRILTDVINIFVSKNSKSKNQNFKEATVDDIERHKTQSVFNFIWISVRAGLLKAMTIK